MTTAATGSAGLLPNLGLTTTINSSFTKSVTSTAAYTAAQLVPTPSAPTPSIIVTGNVTMIPDSPGFDYVPPRLLSSAVQVAAIQSAAANTAAAYGLNETIASDTATIEQLTLNQKNAALQPTIVVTQVIIPP